MSKIIHRITSISVIVVSLLITFTSFSQTDLEVINESDKIIQQAESIYGIDDRLINGEFYQNTKIVTKGHPNFLTNKWSKGPLYIKGVTYDNVSIKYNIEIDKVILLAQFSSGNIMQLALNNRSIDSMYIEKHLFINAELLPHNLTGFLEPLYEGSFKGYLKHKKTFLNKTSQSLSSQGKSLNTGSYRKMTSTLFLSINNEFVRIGNRKALTSIFPDKEKEITRFIKRNRISFRNIDNNQLINLLKYCDEISSEQNN